MGRNDKKRMRNKKKLLLLVIIFTVVIFTIVVEAKNDNKITSTNVELQHEVDKNTGNSMNAGNYIKKEVPKNTVESTQKGIKNTKTKATSNINELNKNKQPNKAVKIKKTKQKDISKYNFKNDLFLGDSLTEGLSFYELVGDQNVIGIKGLTTLQAMNQVQNIAKRNPKNIFILLGVNDLQMATNGKKFVNNYLKLIKMIKEKSPNSKIYVQSLPPVTQKAEQKYKLITNLRINEFNNAIKNIAQTENVNFINIAPVFENNKGLQEKDGIHLKYKFYGLWLNYIKSSVK